MAVRRDHPPGHRVRAPTQTTVDAGTHLTRGRPIHISAIDPRRPRVVDPDRPERSLDGLAEAQAHPGRGSVNHGVVRRGRRDQLCVGPRGRHDGERSKDRYERRQRRAGVPVDRHLLLLLVLGGRSSAAAPYAASRSEAEEPDPRTRARASACAEGRTKRGARKGRRFRSLGVGRRERIARDASRDPCQNERGEASDERERHLEGKPDNERRLERDAPFDRAVLQTPLDVFLDDERQQRHEPDEPGRRLRGG